MRPESPLRETLVLDGPADIAVTPLAIRPVQNAPVRIHSVYLPITSPSTSAPRLELKNGAGDVIGRWEVSVDSDVQSLTWAPGATRPNAAGQENCRCEIPPDLVVTPEMTLCATALTAAAQDTSGKVVVVFERL